MNEKLIKFLENKTIEELANLRGITSAIVGDYDKSLTTYATLNDDKAFLRMPQEVKDMHEKRNKLHALLMKINSIIENKLFNLYLL
jgi:hypothetical protein